MGDIVCDVNLFKLLDNHYTNQASFTVLCEKVEKPAKPTTQTEIKSKPFHKDHGTEKFVHVLDKLTGRLLGFIDPFDLKRGIQMKTAILARHPKIVFRSDLQGPGIVVCSTNICKILAEVGPKLQDFFEDFVSFVTYNQYNKKLHDIITQEHGSQNDYEKTFRKFFQNDSDLFRPFIYITSENIKYSELTQPDQVSARLPPDDAQTHRKRDRQRPQ